MCIPFLIRNWTTGVEYELASKDAFDRVYGGDPSWYIVTGEHSEAVQAALAKQAPSEDAGQIDVDAGAPTELSGESEAV